MLVRKLNKCSDEVKCQLFKTYCYNMYSAHSWCNYPERKLRSVKVAYNNVFRNFFNLKKFNLITKKPCSVSNNYVKFNIDSFNVRKIHCAIPDASPEL